MLFAYEPFLALLGWKAFLACLFYFPGIEKRRKQALYLFEEDVNVLWEKEAKIVYQSMQYNQEKIW